MPASKASNARLKALKAAKEQAETRQQWAFDNQAEIYRERDRLIRALSKAYPSHLMRHRGNSNPKPVVCIVHPEVGQLCWTLMGGDEQAKTMFRHLEWTDNDWDGHKTADRNDRLDRI